MFIIVSALAIGMIAFLSADRVACNHNRRGIKAG